MAEVRRGFDTRLRRPIAVKLVRSAGHAEPERFLAEIRTLAQLEHPGIVRLLDAGSTPEGHPYLVMELVEGATLAATVAASPIPRDEVARIAAGVAGGLAYVHARGIVHRDVKPANILLGPDDRVRLADFGIARLVDTGGITVEGLIVGTPAYLAPEQVSGAHVGPPADVYALGLVLAECLTGVRVFAGPPGEAAAARLRPVALALPGVPPAWRALLEAMTSASADERPTAAAVASAVGSLPGSAPVTPVGPGPRPATPGVGPLTPATVALTSVALTSVALTSVARTPIAGDTEVLTEPPRRLERLGRPRRRSGRRQAVALAAVALAGLGLGLGLGLSSGPAGRPAALTATGRRAGRPVGPSAQVRRTAASTTSAPATTTTSAPATTTTSVPTPTAPATSTASPAAAARALVGAVQAGLVQGTVSMPAARQLAAALDALTTDVTQGVGPLTQGFAGLVSTFDALIGQGQVAGAAVGQIQGALAGLAAGLGLAPPPPAPAGPSLGTSGTGTTGSTPGPGHGHGHGHGHGPFEGS